MFQAMDHLGQADQTQEENHPPLENTETPDLCQKIIHAHLDIDFSDAIEEKSHRKSNL